MTKFVAATFPNRQFLTLTPDLSEGRSSDGKLLHTDVNTALLHLDLHGTTYLH
jgi:hypothetical protein